MATAEPEAAFPFMQPVAVASAPSQGIPSSGNLLGPSWALALQPSDPAHHARFEALPGQAGWRVATLGHAPPPNSVRLAAALASPVSAESVALIRIEARAIHVTHETAEASLAVTVQNRGGAFIRCAEARFAIGSAWRAINLPFRFGRDFATGEVELVLGFGYQEQTVEVRDVSVLHYGNSVEQSDLPRTAVTYAGRTPDAPWRTEAEGRIRHYRQSDLQVLVTDMEGRPIGGAKVEIRLVRHAFEFGTCVPLKFIHDDSPDAVRYRENLLGLFNAGCPENDLKWARWRMEHPESQPRERVLAALAWLRERGIAMRGHVFIWPSWSRMPACISRLRDTPEERSIPRLVREHIIDIASATRGLVTEWDVVNEPFNHNDLMARFGDGIMAEWFQAAREVLPNTPLFLNDWGTHDIDSDPAHVAHFVQTARRLLDQGAPLGGLGLQSHIGGIPCPPASLLRTLDHYAATLELPVRITEFDMAAEDEELQAEYLRDFFTAVFSHPSTVGLQMWGFWAGEHWWPAAALFRKDWSEKPNGRALRTLLKQTWHTEITGTTDRNGRWEARGYHGEYEVTATLPDGTRSTARFALASGQTATCTLAINPPAVRTTT
jgi:endo-1,4-beta-xylanase